MRLIVARASLNLYRLANFLCFHKGSILPSESMQQTKMSKAASIVYHAVVFALFALAGFNLLALRGVYLLAAFGLCLLHFFLIKRIAIRPVFFFVAALTLSLAILYCRFTSFNLIQLLMIGILPIFAFLIGQNTANDKEVFAEIAFMALGYMLTVFLNHYVSRQHGATIGETGISFYYDQQLQTRSPRTFVAIDFIPGLALGMALLFLTTKKRWFISVPLGLSLTVAPLVLNGFVGNRSLVLVAPILLDFFFLYFGFKASSGKKKILSFAFFFLLVAAEILIYFGLKDNFLGIRVFADKIPAIYRFIDPTGSGRKQQYEAFFKDWLDYPRGGMFVAGLFGGQELHNSFLQVYTIGGWLPFVLEAFLLIFWLYLIFIIKVTKVNRVGVITSIAVSVAFFAICLFEPMITSEPFICSLFFLCAGYLFGEWTRQRNKRNALAVGLSNYGGPSLSIGEALGKVAIVIVLTASATILAIFSDYGSVFSVISLLLLVTGFALLDKADYSASSIMKTILCLVLSAAFTVFLNVYLPTNAWMYALAKSALSIAVFIFLRIVIVSKKEKDGYCRLRNFFTKLARDIDGSQEEGLVGQDLQTNGQGEWLS